MTTILAAVAVVLFAVLTAVCVFGYLRLSAMLKEDAKARGFDIVMFGHTHRPCLEQDDDIVALNPGSLSYPRQEGRKPSYVIMETDRYGKAHFTIHYVQ